jgi:hypothetical protein
MVSEATALALGVVQFACGVVTLLVGLRIIYVLSANPIGEFTAELVYLRMRELRQAATAVLLAIAIQVVQMLLPLLGREGWFGPYPDVPPMLATAQALLILVATVMLSVVVGRYTHRALDRRIRESMETLAYLEGQRRRRRSADRGEYERPVDEE